MYVHGRTAPPFVCTDCAAEFDDVWDLSCHRAERHPRIPGAPQTVPDSDDNDDPASSSRHPQPPPRHSAEDDDDDDDDGDRQQRPAPASAPPLSGDFRYLPPPPILPVRNQRMGSGHFHGVVTPRLSIRHLPPPHPFDPSFRSFENPHPTAHHQQSQPQPLSAPLYVAPTPPSDARQPQQPHFGARTATSYTAPLPQPHPAYGGAPGPPHSVYGDAPVQRQAVYSDPRYVPRPEEREALYAPGGAQRFNPPAPADVQRYDSRPPPPADAQRYDSRPPPPVGAQRFEPQAPPPPDAQRYDSGAAQPTRGRGRVRRGGGGDGRLSDLPDRQQGL